MPSFLLYPGRNYRLSLAEILAYFSKNEIIEANSQFFLVETNKSFQEIQKIQDLCGGMIKIAIFCEKYRDFGCILEKIEHFLQKNYFNKHHKVKFGLSVYGEKNIKIGDFLIKLKKKFKKMDKNLRFLNKNDKNLESYIISKEHLLSEKGCELNITKHKNEYFLSKTISVQNIDAYSKRDFDKPGRDTASGLLPPKLAQMMINIAKAHLASYKTKNPVIYDPFCGSGVIPLEGLLMGHNVIGSDISKKAIQDSEENILWLYEQFGFESEADIFLHDATKIFPKSLIFDAIATETYLGPPQRKQMSYNEYENVSGHLMNLYEAFFKNIKPLIKNQPIVMAFPCFRIKKKIEFLKSLPEKFRKIGFVPVDLIDPKFQKKFHLEIHTRKSLVYIRPDQFTGREIFCLKRG